MEYTIKETLNGFVIVNDNEQVCSTNYKTFEDAEWQMNISKFGYINYLEKYPDSFDDQPNDELI